jgi:hypothetical protein
VHAPQQRTDASGQLLRHDRLGHVVVGTRLEPGDHVVRVGLRGDHDDRHDALGAQGTAHVEARHVRESQIEQHQIGRSAAELDEAGLTAGRLANVVALVLERHRQRQSDSVVVFDEQQRFHERTPVLRVTGTNRALCYRNRTLPATVRHTGAPSS